MQKTHTHTHTNATIENFLFYTVQFESSPNLWRLLLKTIQQIEDLDRRDGRRRHLGLPFDTPHHKNINRIRSS